VIGVASLLALAADTPPSYPANDVLQEFRQICHGSDVEVTTDAPETVSRRVVDWERLADKAGWLPVKLADSTIRDWDLKSPELGKSERRDFLAVNQIYALNHILATGYLNMGRGEIIHGNVYSKKVAGRTVFLSTFGASQSSESLIECRLSDPLGDGIYKSPITKLDVTEVWDTETKVKKGAYGSQEFSFPNIARPARSFRIHIGFNGLPLSSQGRAKGKIDPYAIYGMTIVNSEHEVIVVV
jgi:hypothetical protein